MYFLFSMILALCSVEKHQVHTALPLKDFTGTFNGVRNVSTDLGVWTQSSLGGYGTLRWVPHLRKCHWGMGLVGSRLALSPS